MALPKGCHQLINKDPNTPNTYIILDIHNHTKNILKLIKHPDIEITLIQYIQTVAHKYSSINLTEPFLPCNMKCLKATVEFNSHFF